MSKLKEVGVCLRLWNNPLGAKMVRKLLEMGVGRIDVMVNISADMGATKGFIGSTVNDSRVEIHPIWQTWSWVNALNWAYHRMFIARTGSISRKEIPVRYFLSVSAEVIVEEEHLIQMIEAMHDEDVAAVGTSLKGLNHGKVVELGPSYSEIRNTFALWDMQKLGAAWSWDPYCDWNGGQEDKNALFILYIQRKLKHRFLDLEVPLLTNKNQDQGSKEAREILAEWRNLERWRAELAEGSTEREMLEILASRMQIQEPDDANFIDWRN